MRRYQDLNLLIPSTIWVKGSTQVCPVAVQLLRVIDNCLDSVPCNSSIGVSFRFGNRDFYLSPKVINIGNLDNTTCVGGLVYDPLTSKCESKNELRNQNSLFD